MKINIRKLIKEIVQETIKEQKFKIEYDFRERSSEDWDWDDIDILASSEEEAWSEFDRLHRGNYTKNEIIKTISDSSVNLKKDR